MTTKTNTAPLPASAMRALAAAGAAGNVPAAQAFVAQLAARGTFAHLDTPQARASFAAHTAARSQAGAEQREPETVAEAANLVLTAGRRVPATTTH